MPVYIAPGVYSNIMDLSQYAAPLSPTICGMVGASRKGPVLGKYNEDTRTFNGPVLVTSPEQFVRTFGTPNPDYQGPYAALLYLQQGRQLWYGRVVGDDAAIADLTLEDDTTPVLNIHALSEGEWGNSVGVTLIESDASTSAETLMKLTVYESTKDGNIEVEEFDGLSADPDSDQFYETVINGTSEYIFVEYEDDNGETIGHPDETLDGSDPEIEWLTGGDDGEEPDDFDIIGTITGQGASGLEAFADKTKVEVTLLMAPGYSSPDVVSKGASIAENRGDCMWLMHGPLGLDASQIVDWHNASGDFDAGGGTPSIQIASASSALYWPWVEISDPFNKKRVMVPPVGFAAQRMAFTDNVSEPWFAPAGINRGRLLQAMRIEFEADQGQVEHMYGPGNGNGVNPILNLPMDGITIYGQRTLQRFGSALDRIDVMRMVQYMDRVLSRACRVLVFEKNDPILWDQFKQIVAPFVAEIKAGRGVEEFKVIADESTSTPARRNRNEMHGYILMIPTGTAEKIIINFALFPAGASLDIPQIG